MNKDTLQGNWKQLKGSVKEQWGKLTDDDIERVEGKYDNLVGTVQEKYGKSRENSEREVDSFLSRY